MLFKVSANVLRNSALSISMIIPLAAPIEGQLAFPSQIPLFVVHFLRLLSIKKRPRCKRDLNVRDIDLFFCR